MSEQDTVVFVGESIKALDDNGKVGGYLVRFTTDAEPDLEGDYFDAKTDFDIDEWPAKTTIYYHHGLDATLKHRRLGKGSMTKDDVGVWVEAQLEMRDSYEREVFRLVQEGKMGWSSGTAGHLVERKPSGKANHFERWPLGLDASITPAPAEYRNHAIALKTLVESDPSFEALMPEARAATLAASADDAEIEVPNDEQSEENDIMANEAKSVEESAQVDVSALVEGMKSLAADVATIKGALEQEPPVNAVKSSAPAVNTKTKRGDSEVKAIAYYVRTGDAGAFGDAVKASNDTDMNILTPADGGYAVPTGHYQGIIAKRDEGMLMPKLGVRRIPGKGTTVNVPADNGSANVFVTTLETSQFDRDAPALTQIPMTLVKRTKKIVLSDELLEDEDSRVMEFLNDYVGRALALTHNSMLVTEALASGSSVALTAAAAASTQDIPTLIKSLKGGYADGAQFVMRRATHYEYLDNTGDNFQFVNTPNGPAQGLWGYPVAESEYVGAVGASQKSSIFGNFGFMGFREAPGLTFLRDPYSSADTGQVNLFYYFRAVYKVLLPEAIKYGQHPSA
jgi:HK97 family phage major capsid protein